MDEKKYQLQAKPENEMKFNYGGQAVIEGVMMRGAHKFAVAVRAPDETIVTHEQPLSKTLYRSRITRTPFVRGIIGLWDAMGLGVRALMWSADVALQEEENENDSDNKPKTPPTGTSIFTMIHMSILSLLGVFLTMPNGKQSGGGANQGGDGPNIDFNGPIGWTVVAISFLAALGIFLAVPHGLATLLASLVGIETLFFINILEGVIQLIMLIGYIGLTGLMPDMRRVFGYHGAEHKTINAYEAGAELTPEIVQQYPIEHPRCGTAFLLTVVFISILVFAIVDTLFGRLIITRLLFIPLVAGIAYEVLRFTAANIGNPIVRIMVIPNLALQHLTTRQPDLSMIEVGIVSFKRVLISEGIMSEEEAGIPSPDTSSTEAAAAPAGD